MNEPSKPLFKENLALGSKLFFLLSCVGSLILLLALAVFRQDHAAVHAFDSGLYLQLLSSLSQYGDFASSVTGEPQFLAHHFQPILLLLAPFFPFYPKVLLLFISSGIAISLALFMLYRAYGQHLSWTWLLSYLLAILWHPSVAGRIFYSFVPETLALPALVFQALLLIRAQPLSVRDRILLILAQIFAGFCKETLWLVNCTVALLLAYKFRPQSKFLLSLAVVQAAVFVYLFFSWMPAHSQHAQYYAFRYFDKALTGSLHWQNLCLALLANAFSWQSLHSFLLYFIALSGFVPFFSPNLCWLAAAPGMLMILTAAQGQVHHPLNQYQVLFLPFLWVSGMHVLSQDRWPKALLGLYRLGPWFLVLMPLAFTIPSIVSIITDIENEPSSQYIGRDMARIRTAIPNHMQAKIMVDGNLQPLLADYRQVSVLLEFTGNPLQMREGEYAGVSDVVTRFDPRTLASCRDLKTGEQDPLLYDYEAFYRYCEWMKSQIVELIEYRDSGLLHFRMKPEGP